MIWMANKMFEILNLGMPIQDLIAFIHKSGFIGSSYINKKEVMLSYHITLMKNPKSLMITTFSIQQK